MKRRLLWQYIGIVLLLLSPASKGGRRRAEIRGRLARMLCMQNSLEMNSTKAQPPLRSPLYDIQDIPCRVIIWRDCDGGSGDCKKFSSILRYNCSEELHYKAEEVSPKHYGGDVATAPEEKPEDTARGGLKDERKRWLRIPHPLGGSEEFPTVFYEFEEPGNRPMVKMVNDVMRQINECTCIGFFEKNYPWPSRPDVQDWIWIKFTKDAGCESEVIGRKGGRQFVQIDPKCSFGSIIHEFVHMLGFDHEHARSDRNAYVNVYPRNATPQWQGVIYHRLPWDDWEKFKQIYDYHSIMQYAMTAFSKGSLATIEPQQSNVYIGQRCALSEGDVLQLNLMYNCSKEHGPGPFCKMYIPNGNC